MSAKIFRRAIKMQMITREFFHPKPPFLRRIDDNRNIRLTLGHIHRARNRNKMDGQVGIMRIELRQAAAQKPGAKAVGRGNAHHAR